MLMKTHEIILFSIPRFLSQVEPFANSVKSLPLQRQGLTTYSLHNINFGGFIHWFFEYMDE